MKKTAIEIILDKLKQIGDWCPGGSLERMCGVLYKPSNISRRLREMAEEGLIYKDYETIRGCRTVKYKFKKLTKKKCLK